MGNIVGIILWLVIGGVCGWLAGKIMKTGYSLLFNVILGIIGATPFARNMAIKLSTGEKTRKVMSFVEPCVLIVLLVAVTAFLVDSSSNPFRYFRF